MGTSFNQQFDQHGAWRREFALRLKWLSEWLKDNDLLDAAVGERLRRLEAQMRTSKVMVAFVAEFSRGKSELINAIFFAGYGRRIMPASAGRTTMCPTELGYDADVPPCLRLLPIETRLRAAVADRLARRCRSAGPRSTSTSTTPTQLAQAIRARWPRCDGSPMDEAARARLLERRHARRQPDRSTPRAGSRFRAGAMRVLNMPHPLLEQGLVILDTPGLNAIGAEPELTVSLIPQAHAVVFILGADTGVTRSDLAIWREHLITEGDARTRASWCSTRSTPCGTS